MNNDTYFCLFACCIPVKGANRSLVCDLQRGQYNYIPEALYEILTTQQGKTLDEIKEHYLNDYDEIIDSYFEFLIEKEYIFFTTQESLACFPPLDLSWKYPGLITNAIIDYGRTSKSLLKLTISQLEQLNCSAILLRVIELISIDELKTILNKFSRSRLKSVELHLRYEESLTKKIINVLTEEFPRISSILIFEVNKNNVTVDVGNKHKTPIFYLNKPIQINSTPKAKHPKFFHPNISLFTESIHFNVFFNKKVYIDDKGNIKNAPVTKEIYGNIQRDNLSKIVENDHFKKYWKVKKDSVEICKDCEYRYMCVDSRIPIKKENEPEYYFEDPCNYNPYTNKWG